MGFASIPQNKWNRHEELICVPKELINPKGPIYTRTRNIGEQLDWLRRKEEILNHIFDLTFSIVADDILKRLFYRPLGLDDDGPFESFGREINERYGWGMDNVMQQDGFFVSPSTLIGVELKLEAKPSPVQIVKYAAMMTSEEIFSERRREHGLLFIIPESSLSDYWAKCGLKGPEIDSSFIESVPSMDLNKRIREIIEKHAYHFHSLLEGLKLAVVTWSTLREELLEIESYLDPSQLGEQTLQRLIVGFRSQIEEHDGTGVN